MQITNDDISDVIDSCDYTRFDNQLIKLQTGNDILQHNMSNIQKDLDKQRNILSDLEQTIKSLPQQIAAMQEKFIQNNRQNVEDLKDFIRKEIQMQNSLLPPPVDEKIILIAEMRETLKKHDKILEKIITTQNDSQTLLNDINLEKHTQTLKNTISEKLAIMPQINAKVTAIDNKAIPRNMLNDVVSNQENIKNLLKEINLENHTQALTNIISNKLAVMPQIDVKLNLIENNTIPKTEHLKFYHNVHQYFRKIGEHCLSNNFRNIFYNFFFFFFIF